MLESWARAVGLWQDDYEKVLTEDGHPFITEGREARVFDDGRNVIKLISTSYYETPQELLDRISLHNAFFRSTTLSVMGFGRDAAGRLCVAVRQPYIKGRSADREDVEDLAAALGQKKIATALSGNDYASRYIYLADLNAENVLVDEDGVVHVIDCDIRLNTPSLRQGGEYIIPPAGSRRLPTSIASSVRPLRWPAKQKHLLNTQNTMQILSYVPSRLRTFTLQELEGGINRVDALLSSMRSVDTVTKALALHKEMARENLLNEFSDVTPGGGMFNAASVEDMTVQSLTMGRTGSDEALSYEDLLAAKDTLSEREADRMYNSFLSQYKAALSYSLTRTKAVLEEAAKKARTELMESMGTNDTDAKRKGLMEGIRRVYGQISGQRMHYPVDGQDASKWDAIDRQIAFLKKNGVEKDVHSIVLNGLSYGLNGGFSTVGKGASSLFHLVSPAEMFAKAESELRRIVMGSLRRAADNQIPFINTLPITYLNGNNFVGYSQALLRLAFEDSYSRNKHFLPIVADREMMSTLGIYPNATAKPVYLMLGQMGTPVLKELFFLGDTTFIGKYAQQSNRLESELARRSNERQDRLMGEDARRDTLNDKYPNPIPEKKSSEFQDLIYQVALETAFGVCSDASYDVKAGGIEQLDEKTLAAQYEKRGMKGSMYWEAMTAGEVAMKQVEVAAKKEGWEPEYSINLQEFMKSSQCNEEKAVEEDLHFDYGPDL